MNGFRRTLLGYRRADVEAAISARDARIIGLEVESGVQRQVNAELERETAALSGMVLEREREIRVLGQRLREANECHDRSIASLDAITARLDAGPRPGDPNPDESFARGGRGEQEGEGADRRRVRPRG
jgi:uncharacterized coiled-coil protein SlyX